MASRTIKVDTSDLVLIQKALEMYGSWDLGHPTEIKRLIKKCESNMKTIKVSSRKGKGRGLQQKICRDISEITGIPYNQGDDNCLIHSREMGLSGLDVILHDEALEQFPFSVECKCAESFNLQSTYEQIQSNSIAGTDWLIVHKRKSIPEIIVMLSWEAFKRLIKERK